VRGEIPPHENDGSTTPDSALNAISRYAVRENPLETKLDVLQTAAVEHCMLKPEVLHRFSISHAEIAEPYIFVVGGSPSAPHIKIDVLLKGFFSCHARTEICETHLVFYVQFLEDALLEEIHVKGRRGEHEADSNKDRQGNGTTGGPNSEEPGPTCRGTCRGERKPGL